MAPSGAINPGARTVAPDGSVAHSQGRSHGPELYRDTRDGDPYPSAVAVGPNGQVVFDFGCQIQIRMIVTPTTSAVPATTVPVAGNTCGDSGDGGPAVSAELESNPRPGLRSRRRPVHLRLRKPQGPGGDRHRHDHDP